MRYEHLVEINDFSGHVEILNRDQVWSGLMHRVEDARPFLPGLEFCQILTRSEDRVERRLRFGTTEILDRVSYAAPDWVRFETEATEHHGGGVLTIRIEEPEPLRLFLRFIYETVFAVGTEAENAPYADLLRQAYEAADIDTVRVIRLLATEGGRQH